LNDAIQKLATRATGIGQQPLMHKWRLPVKKARQLMRLLHEEGISAASIFPGYKGVVDGLREQHGLANYRDDPTEKKC
jgi:hypothetical protein